MRFDPSQYETVKARKQRFYADHVDGRIEVSVENQDLEEKAIVRAAVFLNREDQEKSLARGVGFALELRDKAKSISNRGDEYESVNYSSWLENAEESAVGRALDNAGYASNGKCSLDEMQKAERNAQVIKQKEPRTSEPIKRINPTHDQLTNGDGIDHREYRIPFGKFKQRTLQDVGPEELRGYVEWQEKEAAKSNRMKPEVKEFIERAEKFIGIAENFNPDDFDQFDKPNA